ncbi:MAG: alpha/beta fold hydrolase [Lachnospiraceae bacterium]|nr:alpha/beta fold hydrolase [Lachnospiraceae bacterium]
MIKKEDFYFDSRDGEHQIHAVKWIPDAEKPACIVQIVHGMAEYIDRYHDFANYLAERDILVVGDDHLGHGQSVKPGEHYGYFCKEDAPTVLVRDEHRLKKMMQKQYIGVPYIILGHSMGSFITRNYLLKYGTGVNGAIIVGTGMQTKAVLLCGIAVTTMEGMIFGAEHVSKFTDKASFGAYNKRIPSPKTSVDWLSRNEDNVKKYVKDPMCGFVFTANGFQTLFKLIYNLHNREKLMKMPKNLPVIFLAGSEDPVGDYGRGVKQVYESFKELGMENVQMKLYPKDRHEILNEVDKEDIYGDIYRWILQRI